MKLKETHKYDDIVFRPHHVSSRRVPMTNYDRAAQFSPFAALTGFDSAIAETARLTDAPIELEEDEKAMLNEKLREIQAVIHTRPMVAITHFLPDQRKAGGAYVCTTGRVKRIEEYSRNICLTDGRWIPVERIFRIGIVEEDTLLAETSGI